MRRCRQREYDRRRRERAAASSAAPSSPASAVTSSAAPSSCFRGVSRSCFDRSATPGSNCLFFKKNQVSATKALPKCCFASRSGILDCGRRPLPSLSLDFDQTLCFSRRDLKLHWHVAAARYVMLLTGRTGCSSFAVVGSCPWRALSKP